MFFHDAWLTLLWSWQAAVDSTRTNDPKWIVDHYVNTLVTLSEPSFVAFSPMTSSWRTLLPRNLDSIFLRRLNLYRRRRELWSIACILPSLPRHIFHFSSQLFKLQGCALTNLSFLWKSPVTLSPDFWSFNGTQPLISWQCESVDLIDAGPCVGEWKSGVFQRLSL